MGIGPLSIEFIQTTSDVVFIIISFFALFLSTYVLLQTFFNGSDTEKLTVNIPDPKELPGKGWSKVDEDDLNENNLQEYIGDEEFPSEEFSGGALQIYENEENVRAAFFVLNFSSSEVLNDQFHQTTEAVKEEDLFEVSEIEGSVSAHDPSGKLDFSLTRTESLLILTILLDEKIESGRSLEFSKLMKRKIQS